jgi:hypothetical protein
MARVCSWALSVLLISAHWARKIQQQVVVVVVAVVCLGAPSLSHYLGFSFVSKGWFERLRSQ